MLDPIEGILRPVKRLRIYFIISFAISFTAALLTFMTTLYGRSVILPLKNSLCLHAL